MDFAEIADFPYSDDMAARDIEACLKTGTYHPSYREPLKAYLSPELARLQLYITSFDHQCHFIFAHEFDIKSLKSFIAHELHISHPVRQKSVCAKMEKELLAQSASGDVFSVPDESQKNQIVVILGEAEDPLSSIYNVVRKCIKAMQEKRLYAEYFNKIRRQAWMWKDQGYSDDKIEGVLKATNFNYEKVGKIAGAYKEIQANAGAAVYLMVQALNTKNQPLIDKVENFVLAKSASMSNALMCWGQGVASCDFPVTKILISKLKKCGSEMFFDRDGNFDWDKLYQCTSEEAKNIGYTPHMIMDADKKEGAFLRSLDQNYPNRRQMLNVLKWSPEFKTDKILQDFVAAQEMYLQFPKSSGVKILHSQLANPLTRSEILFKESFNDIPGIDVFRTLYQQKETLKPRESRL